MSQKELLLKILKRYENEYQTLSCKLEENITTDYDNVKLQLLPNIIMHLDTLVDMVAVYRDDDEVNDTVPLTESDSDNYVNDVNMAIC